MFRNEHDARQAVLRRVSNLRHVRMPSRELLEMAFRHYTNAISYLWNPSEEVQLLSISYHPHSIEYIKNPSVRVQKAAVTADPRCIELIDSPAAEVLHLVGRVDQKSLECTKNATPRAELDRPSSEVRQPPNLLMRLIDM